MPITKQTQTHRISNTIKTSYFMEVFSYPRVNKKNQ